MISWAASTGVWRMQNDENIAKTAEKQKKNFAGTEISGKKLGVIGLGAIGVLVANAATHMGMEVYGYDPYISVSAAWSLSRSVKHISNVEDIYQRVRLYHDSCAAFGFHQKDDWRGCDCNDEADGDRDLNFARDLLVDEEAMVDALAAGKSQKICFRFSEHHDSRCKGLHRDTTSGRFHGRVRGQLCAHGSARDPRLP